MRRFNCDDFKVSGMFAFDDNSRLLLWVHQTLTIVILLILTVKDIEKYTSDSYYYSKKISFD